MVDKPSIELYQKVWFAMWDGFGKALTICNISFLNNRLKEKKIYMTNLQYKFTNNDTVENR